MSVAAAEAQVPGTLPAAGRMLGSSPALRRVTDAIARVAPTACSVLIIGESGSGKELVARAIHAGSSRGNGPFVAINCGAIPATLIEAELFGHERGSFTGATRNHTGVFERAAGGTLLLDEVTEMPAESQTRLLRVLESGTFYRVGGSVEQHSDARIVAATNRHPIDAVRDRKLREDLFYRLAVFPLPVPPLRARGEDAVELARAFLAELNARAGTSRCFCARAIEFARSYRWPGNVRELRNAVERGFVLADGEVELAPALAGIEEAAPSTTRDGPALSVAIGSSLEQVERRLIEATLQHVGGSKPRAAQMLGCSLKTLYNKLNSYSQIAGVAGA